MFVAETLRQGVSGVSMNRRKFLQKAAAGVLVPFIARLSGTAAIIRAPFRRVRPGDAAWPSPTSWEKLRSQVGGRLIKLESPLSACKNASSSTCTDLLK